MEEQYNTVKKDFNVILDAINKFETFIQALNEMKIFGFSVNQVINQVNSHLEVNNNLRDQYQQSLDGYEKDLREFTICILVNANKQVYLSRRNNPTKDYYNKYQVPGGGKNKNESYEACGKREVFEETGLEIHELDLVVVHKGFRLFPDGKECMFKCAVYFSLIENLVPKQTESCNNDEWVAVDLKDLGKYDLTDSLQEFRTVIVDRINSKFRKSKKPLSKKRKIDVKNETDSAVVSEDENSKLISDNI